jgi:hypothetical protein
MLIKTTLNFISLQVEWLSSRIQTIINVGKDVVIKGTLIYCWWECKLVQPLWKAVWRFHK